LTWPLIGRSQEMRVIEAAMSDPEISGIVICGAAGVGKSRIAREALSALASKGCEIRWAVGTSSARDLPLGAFSSWAPSAAAETLQLVRGVIDSLVSASPGTTVFAGVDDAHLLDDLSTFVLLQIIERRAAKVVLTLRDGEPIPAGIQEVRKDARLERLDLQALSRDEAATLLSAALGGPVDPDAANRLWMLTQGNVLYLRNIVEQETSDGRLAQQHGYWRWTGDPIVPPSLAELVESRIGTLPSAVADVIDVLAVGEPIDLASLTRIADPAAVEEADTRGLITLGHGEDGVEVRVAHPLYGEVRRKRAAPTRLRRLRGLVATELAAGDDRDDVRVVVRRATLSLDSDLKPDPDLFVRGAIGAVWLADLALADRLANAAIRAGAGAEAHMLRAHVLGWLGRGPEADKVAAATPTNGFTGADYAKLAFLRGFIMLYSLADPTAAKTFIDDAWQTVPAEARGCIHAFLTVYWAVMGKPQAARKQSERMALDRLPEVASTFAAWAITLSAGEAGRTTEAIAAADAGYGFATRAVDAAAAYAWLPLVDARVGALLQSGRIAEASDAAERLGQEAADLPGAARLRAAATAGLAALGAGRLDTACALLEPVVEAMSASGETNGWGYRYQIPLTVALALRGSTEEATAAVDTLENQRHPSWRHLEYEHSIAKAWVNATQGAISEAIKIVMSAAETACANGQFAAEVMCLQTATQFGECSCGPRLRQLAATVEGPRAGVAARFAAALEAGDGAELAVVSEEFERMGDLVAAVDTAAHAAIAYRRQELRGSALGCSTRAEALAGQCGAGTPALRQASERLPLTDREREIVMLLGEGLSSPAIAERLTLSVRTVEGHIYRAMAKTGTSSRDELAALLPRHKPRSHR
jgi:DNA-binding CsgD family transcriptional regulator